MRCGNNWRSGMPFGRAAFTYILFDVTSSRQERRGTMNNAKFSLTQINFFLYTERPVLLKDLKF